MSMITKYNKKVEIVEDLVGEIWRDVVGYEGMYKVSNKGRVASIRKGEMRLMHPHITPSGYCRVMLKIRPANKLIFVHRLVAEAFLHRPEGLDFVNHKDEVRTNNVVENLEWCTKEYNNTYGDALRKAHNTRMKNGVTNIVVAYDLFGKRLATYESTYIAAKEEGCGYGSIDGCINNRSYIANGKIYLREGDSIEKRMSEIASLPPAQKVKIFAANKLSNRINEFFA